MSEIKLQPDKITILEMKILKGKIDSPFEFDHEKIVGHSFELGFEVGFDLEGKMAKADFQVDVETKSEGNEEEGRGFFHLVYIFEIENLNELVQPVKGTDAVEVSGALGNALASITYSTTRGILITRFQGTVLSSFILPVIDPNDLLTKDKKGKKAKEV